MEDKDQYIIHSLYHGYWWPGYNRSQGISSMWTWYVYDILASAPEGLQDINSLVKDCSISIVNALEIL